MAGQKRLRPEHLAAARTVYDHSADLYVDHVGTEVSSSFEAPLDRAVLSAFAEATASVGPGPVLDAGCGPGRIASFLAEHGLEVGGIDLAPRMIDAARAAHPQLSFEVGTLTDLPVADRSQLGVVYWYSIIVTKPPELFTVWQELDRVLADDGLVLVSFQTGDNDRVDRPDAYGSSTTLTLYQHSVVDVVASLNAAGFRVTAEIIREVELEHETTPQAFLLVSRS